MRLNLKFLVVFLVLGLNLKVNANEISNNALPTDPNITHGTAVISQGANQLTIDQQTDKLITNWSGFNIGADAKVKFNQPSSSSSALNHVNSADPSYIYGSLEANGKVILINPNGVIFANGSRVDVGAIVASSLKLSDENFLKDNFVFEKDGIAGIVENYGTIKAFEGGTVALISSIVKNNRTIETPNGSTALLAGEKITLNLNYNQLISYTIDSGVLNSLVENNNAIVANNGQVILSARGLDAVRKSVVNNDGIIEAKGINTEGGKIFLEGDEITVKSNSTLNASGDNGGGQILVGGSWQNSDPTIYQAKTTTIEEGATLNASANNTGNGGEIVVWSDITNDQSITKVQGKLTAEGGKNSGNGGQIETSGRVIEINESEISTKAENGETGQWLIDTGNINIRSDDGTSFSSGSAPSGNRDITPATLISALNSNNVSIYTGINGSTEYGIYINDSIEYTGANDRTLTFKATGTVRGAASISTGSSDVNITSTNAALNLVLWADADGDGDGKVVTPDGNITTNGGHFWAGGGDGSTTWNGLTVGDDYASTPDDDLYGVRFRGGTTLNTGSGNIKISGRDNEDNLTGGKGVSLGQGQSVSITSTGNIEIFATSDSSQAGDVALETNSGTTINVNGGTSKTLTISIATGAADVSGDITGTGNFTKSGAGDLTLSGTNTYTGDTTVSTGTLELTGSLSTSSDLIVSSGATFDLQATQTVASLDLDGTISRSSGTSALTVSGTSDIGGNITTSGNQVYSGAISLTGNSILTSSSGTITLSSTVDGGSTLTTSSSGNLTTSGIIGGTTPLTSLSATAGGNISYVNNITTTGSISLNAEGNVDPNPSSGNITLTTTNSDVTLNADSEGNGTGTFYGNLIINPGSGNVTIRGATIANDSYQVNGTGTLTIESNAASFASDFTSSALTEASTLTGLTIGKSTNTSTVTMNSEISVSGAISIYGGILDINETITSTNTGDLLFQSSTDGANSFDLANTKSISKTGGAESTLTIKSNGMIRGDGANITSVSGTPLNVVLWSNYDGDNSDGGISLAPKITTYGGDVWMGGSDADNGTSTWNGLTVGDGGSIGGGAGTNGNALDLNASINTGGGDVWIRVGTTGSQLALYTTTNVGDGETPISINSGSGDVIIEADYVTTAQTGAIFEITSTGSFTFKPYANSFSSTYSGLNFQGTLASETFTGSDDFAEFKFNNFANLTGFTIGKSTNTSDITLSSAIAIAGPITVYGGSIDVNSNLTATGGNILLDADTGSALETNDDGVLIAGGVTVQTSTSGNITIYGRSGNDNTAGLVGIQTTGSVNPISITSAGDITMIGISEAANSTTARGTYFHTTDITAAGNINITGQAKNESNDYDVSFEESSLTTTNGSITVKAQNLGRINFTDSGSDDPLTAGGGNDITLYANVFENGIGLDTTGEVNLLPGYNTSDVAQTAFTQDIDLGDFTFNNVTGLTVGTTNNTSNITFSQAISVDGPIKAYTTGTGTVTLTANLVSASGTSLIQGELEGTGDFTQTTGTLQVNATGDNSSYTGDIKGDGAFTKLGNSILALSGANTYTGDTTISAGTLEVDGTLAQTAVTVASGATYDVDATDTVLSIEGAGTIDLTDAALTAGDVNDLEFSGVFNGANDFTKVGSGTLTLSGDNSAASYTGRIIIDDGTISVAADSNLGSPNILDADRLILKGGTLQTTSSLTLNTNRG